MALELKLGEKDRAEYGGPEWLRFDPDTLATDMSYDDLELLEAPMRRGDAMTLTRAMTYEWIAKTLPGVRAVFWVARQLAGLHEPEWDKFRPNPLACDWREVAETDPPADGSSEPPSERPRSKKA